jgi:hypothetical protein
MESALKKTKHIWPLVACAALLLIFLANPAPAATKDWVGPKGNTLWTTASNWSPTGQPGNLDTVNLTSTTNKTAFFDAPVNPGLALLTVDASGGSTFTLFQPGNALSAATEIVGSLGKGQVVQTGGTHTNSNFILGDKVGSSGAYTLNAGKLQANGENIGNNGTGLFTQTGGSNTANFSLTIGGNPSGTGTYNLNGGHLHAGIGVPGTGNEVIGFSGTGTFNQLPNSTHIVDDSIGLGATPTGSGTYNMKGGYLQTVDETVGDAGKGTFNQSGGTHQISSTLTVGDAPTGSGTYNLQAGSLTADTETIGRDGTGQFTQSGGTHTVTSVIPSKGLTIGDNSNGTYNLQAGSLTVKNNEIIGNSGTGQFIQSGGTHTTRILTLGVNSNGVYNLNGGTLSTTFENIGISGVGTFNQNGGTNTCPGQFALGAPGSAVGTYNLKSGSLTVGNEFISGAGGSGIFNQTGGTHTVTGILFLAINPGDSGIYNLKGGTLSTPGTSIEIGAPSGSGAGGTFNVINTTTTVTGDVNNSGTVKTTNAKVTWNGIFTNQGAYISDPSTQTFNRDLNVTSLGYLVGGSQDLFIIKGDFDNQSIEKFQWNTVLSSLKFATGADNMHTMLVPGEDNSPNGQANNFTWGSLNITGQKLFLDDGNPGNLSTAFYAEAVIGATFSGLTLTNITNLDTDPIKIYYNAHLAANAYLRGLNYNILGGGGGRLIAHTPVPPSVLLLGSGLLGLGLLGYRKKRG